jgi:hypothetical protein
VLKFEAKENADGLFSLLFGVRSTDQPEKA